MEQWSLTVTGILCVLAVTGNGGVIFLIATRRRLHKKANCFVLSLAVADFTLGAVYLPLMKMNADNEDTIIGDICKYLLIYMSAASITNLCAMTRDRYVAILHPLQYSTRMSPKQVGFLISAAWIAPLLRPALDLITVKKVRTLTKTLDIALYQVIPCIALIVATTRILLIVRRHSRRTAALKAQLRHNYPLGSPRATAVSQCHALPTQNRDALSVKVTVVVTVICTIYLVLKITVLLLNIYLGDEAFEILYEPAFFFMILNSAANPLAYAFFKTDIKREIRVGFCCPKANG